MRILEPATVVTDYLLGAASLWFAARLWRMRRGAAWPLVFVFTALGSIAGGTFHGLGGGTALWKTTTIAIGLASFFLLVAVRVPVVVALAKFMVYATWMVVGHDQFVYVIVDYGISLLIVVAIEIVLWFRARAPQTRWIIASVGFSVVAAIVQQQQVDLHSRFNHNDLYHVVQLAALWLLYRGAVVMSSGTAIADSGGGGKP